MSQQLDLMSDRNDLDVLEQPKYNAGTFVDNMKLPIHRWFRYSAGFSAQWAEQVIKYHSPSSGIRVLDPFSGSGTTLISSAAVHCHAVGYEAHPFVSKIAKIKLNWSIDTTELTKAANIVALDAQKLQVDRPNTESALLLKCYSSDNLTSLEALRGAIDKFNENTNSKDIADLLWLALTCILRETSGAGTAQWQYVLPNKSKSKVVNPFLAFERRISMFVNDIEYAKRNFSVVQTVIDTDAREPNDPNGEYDLVVTSPPYPNNYDYADATRLEMTFWSEVNAWGDLHKAVRQFLITSCSQHSAAEKMILEELLDREEVQPIRNELASVCNELAEVRETKGGKKTYHTMIAAYYADLAQTFQTLRSKLKVGGRMALMIGDSAPYGVYAPADKWLSELAQAAGFGETNFEKVRDRNNKWKNRKHNVPLKEGILWIEG